MSKHLTLTYTPNLAKVKVGLHTKYQGRRSNGSPVRALTDGRYQVHLSPCFAVDKNGMESVISFDLNHNTCNYVLCNISRLTFCKFVASGFFFYPTNRAQKKPSWKICHTRKSTAFRRERPANIVICLQLHISCLCLLTLTFDPLTLPLNSSNIFCKLNPYPKFCDLWWVRSYLWSYLWTADSVNCWLTMMWNYWHKSADYWHTDKYLGLVILLFCSNPEGNFLLLRSESPAPNINNINCLILDLALTFDLDLRGKLKTTNRYQNNRYQNTRYRHLMSVVGKSTCSEFKTGLYMSYHGGNVVSYIIKGGYFLKDAGIPGYFDTKYMTVLRIVQILHNFEDWKFANFFKLKQVNFRVTFVIWPWPLTHDLDIQSQPSQGWSLCKILRSKGSFSLERVNRQIDKHCQMHYLPAC